MKTQNIIISGRTVEKDISLLFPDGRVVLLQYRNYEGDKNGRGSSLDIILPEVTTVHNTAGNDMEPAKKFKAEHVRMADQITVIL